MLEAMPGIPERFAPRCVPKLNLDRDVTKNASLACSRFIRSLSDRQTDLLLAVAAFLTVRVVLAAFVWLCGQHFRCFGPRCTDRQFFSDNFLLNGLFQWDAHQYRILAEQGYVLGQGVDTTAPFFPGFPMAARLVGEVFGSSLAGGIVVNNLACIVGAFFVARLARALELGKAGGTAEVARESILVWTAAPLTLFFSVYLSESLFGLAAVLLFWSVVKGQHVLAAAAGALACYTRLNGVILVAVALLLAWERRDVLRPTWKLYAAIGLGLLGFLAVLIEQRLAFDDFTEWTSAQRQWNRHLVWPWQTLQDDWYGLPGLDPRHRNVDRMYRTQELLALVVLLPLLFIRKSLKLPWALWLLGLAGWLLPLCSHSLISAARYQAGNLYFALAISVVLTRFPVLRALSWWAFGLVLAWYASTYPFGVWAT